MRKLMMRRVSIHRWAFVGAIALAHLCVFAGGTAAQVRQRGTTGQFDFYVLSLSWSPSYCEAAEDRTGGRGRDRQCSGRPFAFVVHGFWPQYERGFPSDCQVPAPRLARAIVVDMIVFFILPSTQLRSLHVPNVQMKERSCRAVGKTSTVSWRIYRAF